MERLLSHVDENIEVANLTTAFNRILRRMHADHELIQQIYEENKKEGYVRVRKVCEAKKCFVPYLHVETRFYM